MKDGHTLLVGGAWTPARSGREEDSLDPADGSVVGRYAVADTGDVDDAVAAAAAASADPAWRGLPAAARARLLWRLADLVEGHADELATLETRDQGQPVGMVRAMGVPLAAEQLRYAAGWCTKLEGAVAPVSVPDALNYTRREPIGVCALLPTWNFPLMSAAGKLAPALAAGNTVVLKPADPTPMTAVRLAELVAEAGFPPGVVNLVTGDADTSRALVDHPGVVAVSFTGSTAVGRDIAARTAPRFARTTLELGGKNPSIVTAHADVDQAVAGNLATAVLNAGQVCAAYSRFYVHASKVDEFTAKIAAAAASLTVGPGLDPATQMGPLVSPRQVERVDGYVRGGVAEGAELLTGGSAPDRPGSFYAPTVLAGVRDDMTVAREEIFGPVLSILSYDDLDDAVARANDTAFGLSAAVWTRDVAEAHRLAERLEAGAVYVNMLPALDAAVPWGGFGASGAGKEMGTSGVLEYTREKSVWIGLS